MKIHYIYLTTNLINNKKYIGQRKCPEFYTPEKDPYLGSGNLLIAAVKKYGKENFKKDILEFCNNNKDADKLEKYYFDKYDVLNKREEFYNRATAGQFWRDKGHSEHMSNKMKEFYSDQKNKDKIYLSKYGMTQKEYNENVIKPREEKKKLGRKIKKYNLKIERLNKKIEKAKYKYFRELTKDLRQEYYNAKQQVLWAEKRKDPEYLRAVREGQKTVDYSKIRKKGPTGLQKNKRNFAPKKYNSIIYDNLKDKNLYVKSFKNKRKIELYVSICYKTIAGLENSLKDIYNELIENNIDISFKDLLSEAKIKYRHLYE